MSRLDQILAEADDIIEKRASAKEVNSNNVSDDEISKLASAILNEDVNNDSDSDQDITLTAFEKIAHSVAILDTVMLLGKVGNISNFEKVAKAKGYSEDQIADFIQNNEDLNTVYRSVFGE